MFLDDEAEVSEEDAGNVSSDEDELENEQDSSLLNFVNDQTQLSQAINGKCCLSWEFIIISSVSNVIFKYGLFIKRNLALQVLNSVCAQSLFIFT